ncbi:hypothetical protein HK102_002962, partial [Quaeritorhiza haematococci]
AKLQELHTQFQEFQSQLVAETHLSAHLHLLVPVSQSYKQHHRKLLNHRIGTLRRIKIQSERLKCYMEVLHRELALFPLTEANEMGSAEGMKKPSLVDNEGKNRTSPS